MSTQGKNDSMEVVGNRTLQTDVTYIPEVDILEDNQQILLVADLPGVDPNAVEVEVENNVLTLAGRMSVEVPDSAQLVGQEYGVGHFRRSFSLTDTVQAGGIKAKMTNGVLRVTIPKRDEVKTRKIEIASN